jgi:serine/threonine-protein kinase
VVVKQRGFLWCPHCKGPHPLDTVLCPETSKPIGGSIHKSKAHDLLGTVIGGKYKIIGHLGTGGMGAVFEAENTVLRRRVAVKVVNPSGAVDALVRLQREAQLIAAVNHPNICDVYDVGAMPDGSPFIVLELLVGETLAQKIRREGPMAAREASDVFSQFLSGVHAAHGAKIVHRDLKPQNVFLAERVGCAPIVKVMDFGLAKDLSGERGKTITRRGVMVGTPQYMAPEQLRGERVDVRADIFSSAIILFEALTGRHPFAAESRADVQARILRDDPTSLASLRPDLPPAVSSVVAQALAKDREGRFSSAHAMLLALSHAFSRRSAAR